MGQCGCSNYNCGCGQYSPPCPPTNSPRPATVVYIQNSWNIPAVDDTAELDVPTVKAFQVGSYIWNPTYGKFKVTSFNATTGKLTIENTGFVFNSIAGTIVPAYTTFNTDSPNFQKEGTWTPLMPTVNSMTVTINSVGNASYQISDNRGWVDLKLNVTFGGTPTDHAIITLPYDALDIDSVLSGTFNNDDPHELVCLARVTSGTHILIRRLDDATFVDSVASDIIVSGSYPLLPA